jgi:signal transduction histidine kinase
VVTELRPLLHALITRYRHTTGEQALTLDCAESLAVRAHPDDCTRAVANLIDNAFQHGRPPVVIRVCETPAGGGSDQTGTIEIEVRDHGPGFKPGFLPRAFDRFSQADAARTAGGTGLGLAITEALAARNGGRVTAIYYPDHGAGLILTLPAAPAPAPEGSATPAGATP